MKLQALIFILSISLNFSCKKEKTGSKETYKGKPQLQFSDFSKLPDSNYDFNNQYDGFYKTAMDEEAKNLISELGITGFTASIVFPDSGIWQLDTGYADLSANKRIEENTVFYWASVGKMATSVIIHQLVEEGKLAYETKLSTWYPDFPQAENISIEHLLTHISGIYSFNSDSSVHSNSIYSSPQQHIALAKEKGSLYFPGEYWSYSNTNYTFLGLIIENIEGIPFSEVIDKRISQPLDLKKFRSLEPTELPENLALAHNNGQPEKVDYSVPFAAGPVISNSREMTIFLHALLSGKLLNLATVKKMLNNPYPMFEDPIQHYGEGIMVYSFKPIDSDNIWLGHSGGLQHYKAILVYSYKSQTFLALSINQNISAEAFANSIFSVYE